MTIKDLFDHLRSHGIYEDCVVKMRILSHATGEELIICNKVFYYDEDDDDFYWFDDSTEDDCIDCEVLGFSTLREIEIPMIDI